MPRHTIFALGLAGAMVTATRALGACASAQTAPPSSTPSPTPAVAEPRPCYMIVMGVVTNREAFRAYAAALPPLYQRFKGEYLAIQRGPQVLEGTYPHESVVISKWPDCAAANAFWQSPEYRQLVEMRKDWGRFSVILAEGLPAPNTVVPMAIQPTAPAR